MVRARADVVQRGRGGEAAQCVGRRADQLRAALLPAGVQTYPPLNPKPKPTLTTYPDHTLTTYPEPHPEQVRRDADARCHEQFARHGRELSELLASLQVWPFHACTRNGTCTCMSARTCACACACASAYVHAGLRLAAGQARRAAGDLGAALPAGGPPRCARLHGRLGDPRLLPAPRPRAARGLTLTLTLTPIPIPTLTLTPTLTRQRCAAAVSTAASAVV